MGEDKLLYPNMADSSHAAPQAVQIFDSFFTAKSSRNVAKLNSYFSRDQIIYIDITLGRAFQSYEAISQGFEDIMPRWPETGRSYPTRIIGNTHSAIVAFTDTPELFGGDIRALAAVDFENEKIVRWVDYWDARNFGTDAANKLRAPPEQFRAELVENFSRENASSKIRTVANELNRKLISGNAVGAAELFTYDGVFEDMTLHSQVLGSPAIERFFYRAVSLLPYGTGSSKALHVVGSDLGGGYEWRSSSAYRPMLKGGIVALELDHDGRISRFTTVWDGSAISGAQLMDLTRQLIEP